MPAHQKISQWKWEAKFKKWNFIENIIHRGLVWVIWCHKWKGQTSQYQINERFEESCLQRETLGYDDTLKLATFTECMIRTILYQFDWQ